MFDCACYFTGAVAVLAVRVFTNVVYGALVGALHSLLIVSLSLAAWYFREMLIAALAASGNLALQVVTSVASVVMWLAPILAATLILVLSALVTFLLSLVKTLLLALWFLFQSCCGPRDRQPLPEPDSRPFTLIDTSVTVGAHSGIQVQFAVFSSSWCWKEASPEPVQCAAPQAGTAARTFSDSLRDANAALLDAPRLVIIGVASCDGLSQTKNEQLAADRARRLETMVRNLGPKDRHITLLSLGQFMAKDCNSFNAEDRARQRPIVLAGVYTEASNDAVKAMVFEGLRNKPRLLPQVEKYSKQEIVR